MDGVSVVADEGNPRLMSTGTDVYLRVPKLVGFILTSLITCLTISRVLNSKELRFEGMGHLMSIVL
jgi:hypothetical protein